MALTEAQEKELLEGVASMKQTIAQLQPLAAKVPELEKNLSEKDQKITELSKAHNLTAQEIALNGLKTKYPDVPEATLKALPLEVREEQAKMLQENFGKIKADSAKTGPNAWANVGGIGPSTEAEDAAQLAERTKSRDESVRKGDVMGVLKAKGRDTVDFLRKHYPSVVGSK